MADITEKRNFYMAKAAAKKEIMAELSKRLTSDMVPSDPKEDAITKIYEAICASMREKQTYFLPVGLSPWHLRSTIISIDILNQGTPKNITVRTLLSEISKAIVKAMLDEFERTGKGPEA